MAFIFGFVLGMITLACTVIGVAYFGAYIQKSTKPRYESYYRRPHYGYVQWRREHDKDDSGDEGMAEKADEN